ncbi:immunoglobulin domain-containing protein, partial [Flavobacterium plurextorum]
MNITNVSNGTCNRALSGATATATVTVNPTPAAPGSSAQTFCLAENKTVNDLVVTLASGHTKKWYSAATGGTALAGTDVLTTNTYFVSQTSGAGCESGRTSVSVTINPTPISPVVIENTRECVDAKGSFTISNYDATYNYVITPSVDVVQNGDTVIAPAGSYVIKALVNGCYSDSSSIMINSKICAQDDTSFTAIPSAASAVTVGDVTSNDTLNGVAVTTINTDVTAV